MSSSFDISSSFFSGFSELSCGFWVLRIRDFSSEIILVIFSRRLSRYAAIRSRNSGDISVRTEVGSITEPIRLSKSDKNISLMRGSETSAFRNVSYFFPERSVSRSLMIALISSFDRILAWSKRFLSISSIIIMVFTSPNQELRLIRISFS